MAEQKKGDITLYSFGTPNGVKASITLEELGLNYKVEKIDISTNIQKEDWYLKICPNGRIPAIVDHEEGDFAVWETGAIMWYLAEKYAGDSGLLPTDNLDKTRVSSWLMFQMGGLGPMQGQANHFFKFAKEDIPYAKNRYLEETKRLYGVLENQLKDHEWLATDKYTIADIANFGWVAYAPLIGLDISKEFPNLKKWHDKILARPAVRRGLDVPEPNKFV